jgi:histidinol-phosphate aminotransferase
MRFLRERFKEMVPYHSEYITTGIKLDANENPYPIPEEMKEHIKKWADNMQVSRYPDTDSMKLVRAIAKAYDLTDQQVVCGVGSDEMIDCILRSTIERDEVVLAPTPSFSMYPQFTALSGGRLIQVPLNEDFSYNVEKLLEAIRTYEPKVVFICHPNNPTGNLLTLEEIRAIADCSTGLVVIDEAYGEFSGTTALPLIKEYANIVILKTFSKAYSLAGARVGYALGDKEVVELINTVKVPYNLNVFSQEIATWAIEHRELFEPAIQNIISLREALYERLSALKLTVYPSYTNFLWLQLPEAVYQTLLQNHIYIRKMKYEGAIYYRITVGTKEENEALLEVMESML